MLCCQTTLTGTSFSKVNPIFSEERYVFQKLSYELHFMSFQFHLMSDLSPSQYAEYVLNLFLISEFQFFQIISRLNKVEILYSHANCFW